MDCCCLGQEDVPGTTLSLIAAKIASPLVNKRELVGGMGVAG